MKKKLSSICLIIMCSFVLQACKSDEYVSDTHKRDDVVARQFDMIRCEKDYGTVCVETTDEAVAREIVKNIDNVVENIELQPDEEERQTIYILSTVPSISLSTLDENVILADYEKVLTGDVTYIVQELLYRYYDCDYWISYGISHINDTVDLDELSQYYSDPDHQSQLQLYGNHFFEMFQDAEECRIEKSTAVSIIKNVCDTKKKITKELVDEIEGSKEKYINSWLGELELPGDFEANTELTEDNLTFYSTDDELFYITLDNIVISIEGDPYNPACVRDISELDEFFSYAQQDILNMQAFVKDNEILREMVDCDGKIVCYKYESSRNVSVEQEITKTIRLATWDSFTHEVAQLYLSGFGEHEYVAIEEGLSEYLGSVKFNGCRKRLAYEYYANDWDYFAQEKKAYEEIKPIDEENFDMELFYHLWAKSFVNGEKDRAQSGQRIADVVADMGRIEEFADMTYMECEDYVAYIINQYGVDEALRLLMTDDTNREEDEKLMRQYLEEWNETMKDA